MLYVAAVYLGVFFEAHVCLSYFLADTVFTFKVRKYFNTNSTYVWPVNAHNYAFTYK